MYGGIIGEIEIVYDKGLVVGVLGLVGNWVVDDGGLDKDEDDGWEYVVMVSSGIDSEGWIGN